MMETHLKLKKNLGQSTDGGGSDLKFFTSNFILTWNHSLTVYIMGAPYLLGLVELWTQPRQWHTG